MIFDKMFTQNVILESAMKATEYRNEVILNNIANSDTPGFKAKNVEFETILDDAIETSKMTGKLDMSSVKPVLKTVHRNYDTRIDESNFDVESEMVNFYRNSSKYDVIVNSVLNNNTRLNAVFTNTK